MNNGAAPYGNDSVAVLAAVLCALAESRDSVQAGRLWTRIARAVARHDSSSAAELAALRVQPADRDRAAILARALLAHASENQQLITALSEWRSSRRAQAHDTGSERRWRHRLSGPWPVAVLGGLIVTVAGGVAVAFIVTALTPASSSPVSSPSALPGAALAAPANVTATATSPHWVTVTWAESSHGIAGFHVDNGCPLGACGGPDAELFTTATGTARAVRFSVTPGSWTCFRVQAFTSNDASRWSGYGCTQTPGLLVPGSHEWTDTGITLKAGDRLGIAAAGTVIGLPGPLGPSGTPSCTPAANFPSALASFPGPRLACWSLIGRIGSGPPFEVGTSTARLAETSGPLYLGINSSNTATFSGQWAVNIAKGGGLPPRP